MTKNNEQNNSLYKLSPTSLTAQPPLTYDKYYAAYLAQFTIYIQQVDTL
ncbi:RND efflux system, outer membrane lipoprotein, NodT family [Trichinella spiralis]|nr:RND efflux system, outer membrane lipoprotein, NodT family [Trichinella spiralis]